MFVELSQLFPTTELPVDETRAMCQAGELLAPLGPQGLFLAEHSGQLIAVDELAAANFGEQLRSVAKQVAQRLITARHCVFPLEQQAGTYAVFGLRLPFETMGAIFGGIVLGDQSRMEQLAELFPTLSVVGRLVWIALDKHREVARMLARNEQLLAEYETLRTAHAHAIAQITLEQQKRIEAEREYARRLEKEVERRSAALRQAVEDARRQSEQLRAYALALEEANLAHEQLTAAANAANRAKSEFLANISHEVRTPMTAILGYVDLLTEKLNGQPEALELLQIVRRNGEYLLSLLNDLLDLAKVEAGKLDIEHVRFNPKELFQEVYELMKVRAQEKNLPLLLHFANEPPQHLISDPTRLRQITLNLVGNAIKFTEQGKVEIRVDFQPEDNTKGKLFVEVVDTGIGIEPEELARIFEPFVQADGSITRRFGGTGLGLAICRRLAGLLGGEISAESTPGMGSTFRFWVPAEIADWPQSEQQQQNNSAQSESDRSSSAVPDTITGRILLAEDSPDNQRFLVTILQKAGAQVTVAENGQEAINLLYPPEKEATADEQSPQFDLVLMDVQMPTMDGCQATRILRDKGCTLPIIALTANADEMHRQEALDAGCNDYVTKPIRRQELLTIVAKYLAKQ